MGENADLEQGAVEALLRYRKALAKVEALEQEEAAAHRALVEWRGRVEKSISDGATSAARSNLVEAGQNAISRLHDIRFAMSEATAELKSAFTTLIGFDDALGYLPMPTDPNAKVAGEGLEE
jgi:DNA repair ATPase RecN